MNSFVKFSYTQSIAIKPEFVAFSHEDYEIENHWAFVGSKKKNLEAALEDILPSKENVIGVERVLQGRTEHGWYFRLSWAQLRNYESIVSQAGGCSAYLRSKGLIT